MLTYQDDSVLLSTLPGEPGFRANVHDPSYVEVWANWPRTDGEVVVTPGYWIILDEDTLIAGVCLGPLLTDLPQDARLLAVHFEDIWPTLVSLATNSAQENYEAPCLLRVPDADLPSDSPEDTWVTFIGCLAERRGFDDAGFQVLAVDKLTRAVDACNALFAEMRSNPAPSMSRIVWRSLKEGRRYAKESRWSTVSSGSQVAIEMLRAFAGQ